MSNNEIKKINDISMYLAFEHNLLVPDLKDCTSSMELSVLSKSVSNDSYLFTTCNPYILADNIWCLMDIRESKSKIDRSEVPSGDYLEEVVKCKYNNIPGQEFMTVDQICNEDVVASLSTSSDETVFVSFRYKQQYRDVHVTIISMHGRNLIALMYLPSSIFEKMVTLFGKGEFEYIGTSRFMEE